MFYSTRFDPYASSLFKYFDVPGIRLKELSEIKIIRTERKTA